MKMLLIAGSALALATASAAQTPPVSSTTGSMTQPTPNDDGMMPPDSSPMAGAMDDGMAADPVDEPTTREGVPTAPMSRPAMTTPSSTTTPQTVNRPASRARVGTPQPMPMAASPAVSTGEYPVCSATVTDRCVNTNDIRRGIAKRPSRR